MTKYKPVNEHVIVEKTTDEKMVAGIYTGSPEERYVVVVSQDDSRELINKEVKLLNTPTLLEGNYYAVAYKDIVAYK